VSAALGTGAGSCGGLMVRFCGVVRGITLGTDAGDSEGLNVAVFGVIWGTIRLNILARCSIALVSS